MIRHYFKIAIRNLSRNKIFSLINILGLAVGMGVCLLIYQYVHFEMSYDQFHPNAQNTYRLTQTTFRNGEDLGTGVFTTYGLGARGKETIPEIEEFVRVHHLDISLVVMNPGKNEPFQEDNLWYVDSTFLHMFDFPLKYGDRESAFSEKYSVVITEQMALKYFGDSNPLGKALKVSGGVLSGDFIVTGVLNALPENSHLQFDFLLPIAFLLENYGQYKSDKGWDWDNFVTYVKLNEGADLKEASKKFDELISTHVGDDLAKSNEKWSIGFQPLADIHLRSDFPREIARNNGDIQDVHFFSIIAIFILLMAWVNHINLSTAQAINRAKEVGVRKSIGALRKQLISQFMMESALINLTAALLSIGLVFFMLPVLNQIMGKEIGFTVIHDLEFLGWFSVIIFFGTMISGLYPAFVMSSCKPLGIINSLKFTYKGKFSLRKGLIVFQFLMSALLISGTYLVSQQLSFMRNQDLGIDMEKILVIDGPRVIIESVIAKGQTLESSYTSFKNKGASHHSVLGITATSTVPGMGYMYEGDVRKSGEPIDVGQAGDFVLVDKDFFSTYELEFLSEPELPENVPGWTYTFINEEAIDAFGLGSPENAIGQELVFYSYKVKILGIVKNFHWSSLKELHSPTLFILDNSAGAYFSIKMNLSDIQETITHIESAYKSVFPGDPFDYFFLDDNFNRQYQADLQFQNLFTAFSLLAIFIACLGLFALVSFSATLKVKEIGVRKVLGASVGNLMLLISREYLLLLAIAVVLAIPMIVFGASSWLENYAYRIDIGLDLLIIPALVLFLIALMTVSYRTYIAANANPVDSLKSE
ncbi:MAG: ABC transporter permease [Anditalea sp.]